MIIQSIIINMIKEIYENAYVIKNGKYLTTVNELTDQIPALRPKCLWNAALEIVNIGKIDSGKILTEEDKGIPIATAVSLISGLPLAVARWYPYEIEGQIKVPFSCEYNKGNLYINGIEPGDHVTIIDDTISTGGTIIALISAIKERNAIVDEVIALVEKVDYSGVERVKKETGITVKTVIKIKVDSKKVTVI